MERFVEGKRGGMEGSGEGWREVLIYLLLAAVS